MLRRTSLAALASAFTLLAFPPLPVRAQYMYLDANGDGVHTEADVLPSTGVTSVDVWLVTNENRDGTPAACAESPTAQLSIISYEFILRADGGTVKYDGFQNRMADFTYSFGTHQSETEFYAGCGGLPSKAPGRYRLASLTIEPLSGAPWIRLVPYALVYDAGYTAFGSQCDGVDYDNTMKLGSDWFDSDGLDFPGMTGEPPAFDQVWGVSVSEGSSAAYTVTATDADSDSLQLALADAPAFVSMTLTSSTRGRVTGRIVATPSFSDQGNHTVRVTCSDGVFVSTLATTVYVRDVNPPPVIEPIADFSVAVGATAERAVTAQDSDHEPIAIRLRSAPNFVTIGSTEPVGSAYQAILRASPGTADAATWLVTVEASDGTTAVAATFQLRAYDPVSEHAPQLDSIPDFTMSEGDTVSHRLHASDADGDYIDVRVSSDSPHFVMIGVDPWLWLPSPGVADVPLVMTPGAHDAGVWSATVVASDLYFARGYLPLSSARTFTITVRERALAPVVVSVPRNPCVEPGEVFAMRIVASDPDGGPVTASFGPPPPWGSASEPTPSDRAYLLEPTSDTAPQLFPIEVHAVDTGGLETSASVVVQVGAVGECPYSGFVFAGGVDPPEADAGGPHAVVAGETVHFDGGASIYPAGSLPRFTWHFGDGGTALGRRVEHRYAEGGTYVAVLAVGLVGTNLAASDSALVTVRDALPARAFLAPEDQPIVLRAERASVAVRLERVGEEYALEDLDPASLCLWSPGHGDVDSVFAQSAKGEKIEDRDRNGVPERTVAFAREDIRRLFANVRGKHSIHARLQGRLPSGARVRAPIELEVLGTPPKGVAIWPNPLNPRGTISFQASRPGRAMVRLYDVNGRLVRTLLDGDVEAGEVQVPFDGFDSRGRSLASGVYFYQVTTADASWRGRATILK